jgi:hypothetical protein
LSAARKQKEGISTIPGNQIQGLKQTYIREQRTRQQESQTRAGHWKKKTGIRGIVQSQGQEICTGVEAIRKRAKRRKTGIK